MWGRVLNWCVKVNRKYWHGNIQYMMCCSCYLCIWYEYSFKLLHHHPHQHPHHVQFILDITNNLQQFQSSWEGDQFQDQLLVWFLQERSSTSWWFPFVLLLSSVAAAPNRFGLSMMLPCFYDLKGARQEQEWMGRSECDDDSWKGVFRTELDLFCCLCTFTRKASSTFKNCIVLFDFILFLAQSFMKIHNL
jgi:hypothetical protein